MRRFYQIALMNFMEAWHLACCWLCRELPHPSKIEKKMRRWRLQRLWRGLIGSSSKNSCRESRPPHPGEHSPWKSTSRIAGSLHHTPNHISAMWFPKDSSSSALFEMHHPHAGRIMLVSSQDFWATWTIKDRDLRSGAKGRRHIWWQVQKLSEPSHRTLQR